MTIDTQLDRLQICNAEITGIKLSLRMQPTKLIELNSLPLIYARPAGMPREVARPGAGQYIVYRRFVLVIMVGITTLAALDASTEGSQLLAAVMPFLDRVADYYNKHPRLDTEANLTDKTVNQGELPGIAEDIGIIDAGPEIFQGVDGRSYAGVRPIITIAERRFSTPKRTS